MAFTAPVPGGIISANNINVTQTGSKLLTASLISQQANFNPWFILPGSGSITATISSVQSAAVPGGRAWSFTSPSNGGTATYTLGPLIPVDSARTYLGRIWAAKTLGTGTFYAGYVAYKEDGTQLVGNGFGGSYGYFIAPGSDPGTGKNYAGWVGGQINTNDNNTKFPTGTVYIRLVIVIVGGASQWTFRCTIPEVWEGPGYNAQSNLWIPTTVNYSVPYNTPVTIASSGSGWAFVTAQGALNGQIYGVAGSANPLPYVSSVTTGWVSGGTNPSDGQAVLNSTGGVLQITQKFVNNAAKDISVLLMGTGF